MGVPVVMGASGQSSSTTLSGISGGTVVIRDEAGQKAQTGQTAAEMIAGLNRDTTDTLNSLDPIFNEREIQARFEIVGEAGRQVLFAAQLPDWLVACFRIALLGEIYPNIRAIAVGYHDSGFVLIRYYLHHQPTDFDLESLEVVATNLDDLGGKKGLSKN